MIQGEKVQRPTKEAIVSDIANIFGLPTPTVSSGSTVESQFLNSIHKEFTGRSNSGADAYRKTEQLLDQLGLTYDAFWDTSETTPTGGGSTVTTRAYSRIRAALTHPRCFIFNVTDAPAGSRWELNHQQVYRYDKNVTAHKALNDAGPGSLVVYYATGKSTYNPKHFFATFTIDYIHSGWKGPWEARLSDYRDFATPIPVSNFALPGWNRQHAITEITFDTYSALLASGGAALPDRSIAISPTHGNDTDELSFDPGGRDVALRILNDYPSEASGDGLEIPEQLPEGILESAKILDPRYIETPDGRLPNASGGVSSRSRNQQRDKVAEERAVDLVTSALERKRWKRTADRQRDGVGYDLEFSSAGRKIKVEVKGIQGSELTFNLTPKELWRAETDEQWLLIAVTSVLAPADFTFHVLTRDKVVRASRVVTGYRLTL